MFLGGVIAIAMLLASCNQKKVITASNEHYNKLYKNQSHISPIKNVLAERQDAELLKKNYQHYAQGYIREKTRYEENQRYLLFLAKNSGINRVKNLSVESVPSSNKEYLIYVAERSNYRDINKKTYLEIEYNMFLNDAKLARHFRNRNGDPIIHPYIYAEVENDKKRIIIGDEYYSWSSICETHEELC